MPDSTSGPLHFLCPCALCLEHTSQHFILVGSFLSFQAQLELEASLTSQQYLLICNNHSCSSLPLESGLHEGRDRDRTPGRQERQGCTNTRLDPVFILKFDILFIMDFLALILIFKDTALKCYLSQLLRFFGSPYILCLS